MGCGLGLGWLDVIGECDWGGRCWMVWVGGVLVEV